MYLTAVAQRTGSTRKTTSPRAARLSQDLLPFYGLFGDVHDVVLEDEQIRRTLPRQAHHIPIVVLDPATHYFPVCKFDAYGLLFFAQLFQVSGFLKCLVRWWSLSATANGARGIGIERHVRHFTLRFSRSG